MSEEIADLLRVLVEAMLNDGDTHVEHYGDELADILRLAGVVQ